MNKNNFRIDSVVNLDCNSEEYQAWLASLPPCGYIAPTLEMYNQLCKQHEDKTQRIAELEGALKTIYRKLFNHTIYEGFSDSLVVQAREIAKKALGERDPNNTVK